MEYYNKTIHVKVNDKTIKELEKLEKEMLIARSSIIRLAIKEFVDRRNKSK